MAKLKKILEIADNADSAKVEIWTESFKASGTVFNDKNKLEKGIVSLKNVSVLSLLGLCECEGDCSCKADEYEWFNIFEDHVIAFTVLK